MGLASQNMGRTPFVSRGLHRERKGFDYNYPEAQVDS
jgi:hypothetical protein